MNIVQFAVRHVDEARNVAAQIEQRVHLHRRLGRAEMRPRKHRQTQIDGRRIERIDRVGQIQTKILRGVQPSSPGRSAAGPNPRRCASREFRWRRPASSAESVRASPCDRASRPAPTDTSRCRAGSPDRSAGQTPSPDTARHRAASARGRSPSYRATIRSNVLHGRKSISCAKSVLPVFTAPPWKPSEKCQIEFKSTPR